MKEHNLKLKAALSYIQKLSWPVFPCHFVDENGRCSCSKTKCPSPGKHPRTQRGFKDATTDVDAIEKWWKDCPNYNIGIATGKKSGFDVLDVDLQYDGLKTLEEIEAEQGKLPETVTQSTGGGGKHIFFKHKQGLRNKTKLRPGLDVRGDGGYIIVAPSDHASGKHYEWKKGNQPGEVELAEWPESLLAMMQSNGSVQIPQNGQKRLLGQEIPEGERNATLASLAGTMCRREMDQEAIFAALKIENKKRCVPPLPDDEVRQIATSIARYETTNTKEGESESNPAIVRRGPGSLTNGPPPDKNMGSQDGIPASSYRIQNRQMGYMKLEGRDNTAVQVFIPLCNFEAEVVEEQVLDNGAEVIRRFAIEGKLDDGCPLPRIEISSAQFSSMNWVMDQWGIKARWSAGMAAKDRLRCAIQANSVKAKTCNLYAHTGWRKINGVWRYLHTGQTDVQVSLDPPLDRYALPVKPENVPGALQASLDLLDVAPDQVTIPLLATVYLAPLCEFLHPDLVVFLVGKTGSLKSTLAALFLSHFGQFSRTTLPASWESTDNALERRLFTLKDTLCVVDDYAPKADAYAQRKQEQRAQRIIRSMGNLSGKSRLRADLSERPEYYPRGVMVSTGEDTPPGQSIVARSLSIEVNRDRLDINKITQIQKNVDRLPHAMAGYIEWLTPQLDEQVRELNKKWEEHRTGFTENAAHLRIPEILAYLALGMDSLMSFARDLGVLSARANQDLAQRVHTALLPLGEAHGQRLREEDPAEVFFSILSAMLAQGAVKLAPRYITPEAEEKLWNNPLDPLDEPDNIIGWKDTEYAYLIPEAAKREVVRYLRESDRHFPYSARALNEALNNRGALVKGQDGKSTRPLKIMGKTQRVQQIPIRFLETDEEPEKEVTLVTPGNTFNFKGVTH